MPIYEYLCDACGHRFEEWQKVSEAAVTTCPSCAKAQVRRLISATSFALKGTGWYVTDYKSNGSSKSTDTADKAGGTAP